MVRSPVETPGTRRDGCAKKHTLVRRRRRSARTTATGSLGFVAGYYTTCGPTIRHRGLDALTLNRQPVNETLDMANILARVDQAASTGRSITLNLHQVLASGTGTMWLSIGKAETLFAGLTARRVLSASSWACDVIRTPLNIKSKF